MTLASQAQNLSGSNGFIELYTLDCTNIGGEIYYFTPNITTTGQPVMWQGKQYIALPVASEGWEYKSDGSQCKPRLQVSNVSRHLLQAVLSLGDIVGAKLIRVRTFENFLDNGSTPNPTAFFPPDLFTVEQKVQHDNETITWQLASVIDQLGLKLPRRLITKDGDPRYGKFPAVGSFRPTGY